MEDFSRANGILLKMNDIIMYVTAVPFLTFFCVLIFWLLNTCVYLVHTYKHLKRLRQNATDSYTQKLLHNVEFNFYKFILLLGLNLVEICVCILSAANHIAFDDPYKGGNKRVCIDDCCLKNRTFMYGIEKLEGYKKYASLLVDAGIFIALLSIFWVFANILQYSQIAFIEKKSIQRRVISKLRWKTAINIVISLVVWVLMGIPQTLLLGYPLYTLVSWLYLYSIITHYVKLKSLRRRNLVDLMYECYDDKIRIKQEQRDVRWTERGSEFVIGGIVITVLMNSLEMILIRSVLPILINPCWLKIEYSLSANFDIPDAVSNILSTVEHFACLLRSLAILTLALMMVVVHGAYIVDKFRKMLKRRRERNDDAIKKLLDGYYVSWNSQRK